MNVYIVAIFYNPSKQQVDTFQALSNWYKVVVVDNSEFAINGVGSGFIYIPLNENKGIAYATNIGIEYAMNNGASHIIIFDQDSKIDCLFINKYIEEYKKILKIYNDENFIIGPNIHNVNEKSAEKKIENRCFEIKSSIIASGMFASINVFKKVGKMDEDFFIDLVDTEYCWRAKYLGIEIIVANQINLFHTIGEGHNRFLNISIIKSATSRYYYRCRNYVWLSKKTYAPHSWKVKRLLRILLEIFWYFLHGNFDIVKESIRGLKDGYAK